MTLGSLSLAFLLTLPAAVPGTWYEHYEQGLQHIDDGQPGEARKSLMAALEARPTPGLRLPTEGIRYVDYLPNLYLAIACQMAGDLDAARDHLVTAESSGAAKDSVAGGHLLEAYQILLKVPVRTEVPLPEPSLPEKAASSSYLDYDRALEVLSDKDLERLKKLVLARCGLAADTDLVKAPWYFHYELAQELERQGDPQRALDALIEATRRRPRPRRGARMYGMWFTDYLPYYQIARTHAVLGNWDCVVDALRIVESLGEIRAGDQEYDDFVTLRAEARAHREP